MSFWTHLYSDRPVQPRVLISSPEEDTFNGLRHVFRLSQKVFWTFIIEPQSPMLQRVSLEMEGRKRIHVVFGFTLSRSKKTHKNVMQIAINRFSKCARKNENSFLSKAGKRRWEESVGDNWLDLMNLMLLRASHPAPWSCLVGSSLINQSRRAHSPFWQMLGTQPTKGA